MAIDRPRSSNIGDLKQQIDPNAIPSFRPVFGKVVIEVDMSTERTYGSLILPLQDPFRQSIGTVVAVYEATQLSDGSYIQPEVSVGDIVLFGQFTGTSVKIAGKVFVICKEHDLLSVLDFTTADVPLIEEV